MPWHVRYDLGSTVCKKTKKKSLGLPKNKADSFFWKLSFQMFFSYTVF